jgi:CBS domain-containing protein
MQPRILARFQNRMVESQDYFRTLFKDTRLEEIMTSPVISLQETEDLYNVYSKFTEHKIKHLIIVDKTDHLKGLITLRDLYSVRAPKKGPDGSLFYNFEDLDRFLLSHVMTKDPSAFYAEDNVGDAIIKMASDGYGCVPIVDRQHVVIGVITQSDIIKIISKILLTSE